MYPFEIKGITRRGKDQLGIQGFAFNKDSDEITFRQLIRNVPPQTKVMFYDKSFPSPSDPGAYVSFMRFNDQYIINRSNQGWSSKWSIIDVEKLENYLSKCSSVHKVGILKSFEKMLFFSQVELPSPDQLSQLPFDDETYIGQHLEPKRNKYLKILLTSLFILLLMLFFFALFIEYLR